jgi:type II secretory pathway pseudopilin PulG
MWRAGRPRADYAGSEEQAEAGLLADRAVPRHYARRAGSSGFTLIEMAIVALVIMIVAAVAIPYVIRYMRMYKIGIASRNVATALQRARYVATSDNTRAEISIRNDQAMIDILEYNSDGTGTPQSKGLVTLPQDISISPNAPRKIAFDGRGVITPLPKESPVIEVDGVDGFFSTVTVALTGQVTVSTINQRK